MAGRGDPLLTYSAPLGPCPAGRCRFRDHPWDRVGFWGNAFGLRAPPFGSFLAIHPIRGPKAFGLAVYGIFWEVLVFLWVSVADMLGNLADLVATGIASEPTLRKWLKDQHDCDWLKKRGSNGDAYEIDISGAIGAWKAKEADKVEAERAKGVILGQMAIDFGLAPPSEPTLTIAERRALIDEEIAALKLGQLRRALVPVASVDAAFADILARYAQRASTFAARLAKKIDLSREQIVAIEMLRAADQSWFADQMENWGRDIVDGNDDSGSPLEASAPDDGR